MRPVLSRSPLHVPSFGREAPAAPWTEGSPGLILDLDGTLMREHEAIEGAADLLKAFHDRYVVVSNNSTHTAPQLARRLRMAGLPVDPARLVLAGESTVHYLRDRHPDARVLMCASAALKRYAAHEGCRVVEDEADVVMLALDKRFSYGALEKVTQELARGARLVVSNTDATHPGPRGRIVPETGALLRAVLACAGDAPLHVVGKPEAAMFHEGLRRLGRVADEVIVIGDNPETDGLGAVRAGMRYLLVGRGPQADAATVGELMRRDVAARTELPRGPAAAAMRRTPLSSA
ncbi:HAD-IIA family hydrolase [Bordetella genomosp. 13]|uniref:HAD-IIA family hydrolase n=1 Tax=Bordetella genomosp. 13 TaxID=463040 RepID=UPI00119C96AD|nr:HAD-IIA family hydrolase [Bordetella genomosp. 13]